MYFLQDQIKIFNLTIASCPPGHILHPTDVPDEYQCICNVQGDENIVSCLQDERKLVLKVNIQYNMLANYM